MPDSPMSIIDFHGLLDDVIPASPNSPENLGPGPDNTTKNVDGYYYHIKLDHLIQVRLPKLSIYINKVTVRCLFVCLSPHRFQLISSILSVSNTSKEILSVSNTCYKCLNSSSIPTRTRWRLGTTEVLVSKINHYSATPTSSITKSELF